MYQVITVLRRAAYKVWTNTASQMSELAVTYRMIPVVPVA